MKREKNTITVPETNWKIVERGKIDIPNTHIYGRSLSCLGSDISVKGGMV